MNRFAKIVIIGFASLTFMACSKKGGSSGAVATAPATTYHITNNLCYDVNNTQVDASNCPTLASSGYHYNGGNCCDGNGNTVNNSYCTGNTGQTCSGFYWFIDYDGSLWSVQCDGKASTGNCSGYDLIQGSTGNYIYCN